MFFIQLSKIILLENLSLLWFFITTPVFPLCTHVLACSCRPVSLRLGAVCLSASYPQESVLCPESDPPWDTRTFKCYSIKDWCCCNIRRHRGCSLSSPKSENKPKATLVSQTSHFTPALHSVSSFFCSVQCYWTWIIVHANVQNTATLFLSASRHIKTILKRHKYI